MAKKNKENKEKKSKKNKNKSKGKNKAKEEKAEAAKAEEAAKADAKAQAKAKSTPLEGAGKKGGKKSSDRLDEQQYVSPFAENDDTYGFGDDQAADLADLEHMLNVEVDEDFFVEPRYFHTLNRVINVLGIQLTDDAKEDLSGKSLLERNPAYQNLQKQAQVVENAIEHMSRVYCNALNRSVIQVGRIAREFDDAIEKVETLRRQVRVIQETIGARSREANRAKQAKEGGDEGAGDQGDVVRAVTPASQMSLRELWMKKLESEALLVLIAKVNVVRDAPGRFDDLTAGDHKTCRIGAATLCLTEALDTMFADDVSQVDALSQILENLMIRKSTAEEILWETLEDVVYLRTANGPVLKFEIHKQKDQEKQQQNHALQRKSSSNEDTPGIPKSPSGAAAGNIQQDQNGDAPISGTRKIYNPFQKNHLLLCVQDPGDMDDLSVDSRASMGSMDSDDEDHELEHDRDQSDEPTIKRTMSASSASSDESDFSDENDVFGKKAHSKKMMIPKSVVESEIDLVGDELRCFDRDTKALSKKSMQKRYLPRYADPVLSLRILVECLVRIGKLVKTEDVLMKNVQKEIKQVIHREQARTFYRLDRRKGPQTIRSLGRDADELKDFRRHFTAILSSFGCIMMRLSHLAQLCRSRILADEELSASLDNPANFLRPVLDKAYSVMQSEFKDFLRACLQQEQLSKRHVAEASIAEKPKNDNKIFTFGVLEVVDEEQKEGEDVENKQDPKQEKKHDPKQAPEQEPKPEEDMENEADSPSKFSEMPIDRFVSSVLFPMTNTTPRIQNALVFRRSMDMFTRINEARAKELAHVTGESAMAMRRKSEREELAIEFLDKAVQDNVLPYIQTDALTGTIVVTEMKDAFDPPAEANVYARADKIKPLDVAMVQACEGMLEKTEPLFMAIHRLPPTGEMYQGLVEVMMVVMQTFNASVEKAQRSICEDTTAEEALEGLGRNKGKLMSALGKRQAFVELLKAYEFDLDLIDEAEIGSVGKANKSFDSAEGADNDKDSPGKPLSRGKDGLPEKGIEREEAILKLELELLEEYLDFFPYHQDSLEYDLIPKAELKRATCLAHSLLKVASILETRIKSRAKGVNKLLDNTEELHEKIKELKGMGMKMAKYCHVEVLLQVIRKMAPICKSTTLCAKDAVRIPTSVNGVGEFLTGTMDYLRESTSNTMAAYAFSNLGQYIPACLMSTVRVIAHGEGIIDRAPLTMNGIESLDRSAAVLYKDLKAAVQFQSKFFDIQVTAVSFERAATFMTLMEMSIEELAEYYTTHSQSEEFSDDDFELMFKMDGPRRVGDDKQFKKLKNVIKKRKKEKEEKKEAAAPS